MKNKVNKIFLILVLGIILFFAFCQIANAWTPDWTIGDGNSSSETKTSLYTIMNQIINILLVASVGIAIIVLTVLGIKFMGTSPEGRADFKKSLVPYVVGAIIVFSAIAILKIISSFATGISDSIETTSRVSSIELANLYLHYTNF